MTDDSVPFAREGYKILFFSGLAALSAFAFSRPLGAVLAAWGAFCLYFFRNPKRVPPPDGMVCPADGKVIFVGPAREHHFLNRGMNRVTIFMSPFNVHVNRAPVTGTVKGAVHKPGKFLAAFDAKASDENERFAHFVTTDDGDEVVFVQIAGWFARRIVSYLKPGDRTERGQIFGLIKFGSRMDVYLPDAFRAEVAVGDKVKAGETVIARKIATKL